MTNSTGITQFETDYYPHGAARVITSTKDSLLKFQGSQLDTESGLINARFMYSAGLARFLPSRIAQIPKKPTKKKVVPSPQTLNSTALAASNPLGFPDSLGSFFRDLFAPSPGSEGNNPCADFGCFPGPPDFAEFPLPFTISFTTCSCNTIGSVILTFPTCIYRCKCVDGDNAPSSMNVFVLDAECKRVGTPIRFGTCPRRVETARIRINIFDAGASVHFDKPTLCSNVD